jgi:hypothetical protein
MSSNPFLQSNRFHLLDSENTNKQLPVKDNKNNYKYESSNNSFNKPSSNQSSSNQSSSNQSSSRPISKDNYRKDKNNHFKDLTSKVKPIEFTITDALFPTLTPILISSNDNFTNFKDALNHQAESIVIEDITLSPGWIQISKVDNKSIISQDKLGPYDYKMQELQTLQELQEDPNYIMNKAIISMQRIWLKYKTNYDNIYGEGAYDDLHYSYSVYNYESDESDELYDNDYNDNDNDNDINYDDSTDY